MKKLRMLMVILVGVTLVCSACNKGGVEDEKKGSEGEKAGKDLSGENSIMVYSPQGDEERGKWIIDRAKKDLGIDLKFLCAGGGELADRLAAEKGNPQADVVMGLVQSAMYSLKDEEILEPYVPAWAKGLDPVYKDKDGYFCSFWQTPIVLAYNSDDISDTDAPTSWEALADSKYKGQFAFGQTTSQTVRTYLVGILWNYYDSKTDQISDKGWELLRNIYANAGTWPSADDAVWKALKDGELPILPNWFGGIAANTKKNNIPVKYVNPQNGTPIVAEAIGLVKGSKKEENAKKYIDWWGSAEVMSDYAKEFGQVPAHPDAIEKSPEDIKEQAKMFQPQNIDWEVVSKHMNEWMEKIELEIIP